MKDLTSKLAELGWLYHRVQRYIQIRVEDAALGLVGQVRVKPRSIITLTCAKAFCSVLQQELTEYYRLIAVLEGQIQSDGSASLLTMRRLIVWTFDPLHRMRVLASMVDYCAGMSLVWLMAML